MDTCKVGEYGASQVANNTLTFCNTNPNLPSNITVGQTINDKNIFCSDKIGSGSSGSSLVDEEGTVCYEDIPSGLHRALSNFNIDDYKRPIIDTSLNKEVNPLTLDDIDKLVPGMWLKCLYDTNDDDGQHYEAMFVTADIKRVNPLVSAGNAVNGHIAVDFEDIDEDEEEQKWIPISWCYIDQYYKIHPCDDMKNADSDCDYIIEDDSIEAMFHRAMKGLTTVKKERQSDTVKEKKVLFTYSQYEGEVVEDDDGHLYSEGMTGALPIEMDTTSYTTIYSHLPFSHPEVQQLDNKFKLYQLYKDDPVASKVFPQSYSTYSEALQANKNEDEDVTFYIKSASGARGEDIYIKTWDELSSDYNQLKKMGLNDVNQGEGDVIIQKAVTDLYTIQGDGILSKRRFDIRYYVIIAHGKVYLHSFMLFRWSLGTTYDPKNTNVKTQVINVAAYGGGEMSRLFFLDTPHNDDLGNTWTNNKRKRRKPSSSNASRRRADPHGWRDAVADALDDASSVFSNLKEITKSDPSKYVLAGGDAMILEDGSAVIVEFNIWPDLGVSYSSLDKCLAEDKGCRRMVLQTNEDSDDMDTDNYVSTEPSPASSIASTEGLSEVFREMLLLVMKVKPAHEIEGLREIEAKSWDIVDLREGKRIQGSTQIQSLSNVMEVCDGVNSLLDNGSSNKTQALSCPSLVHNASVHPVTCVVLDTSNSKQEIIDIFSLERDPTVQRVAGKFLWHRISAMVIVLGLMFLFNIGSRKVSRSQIILLNVVIAVIAVASDVIPRQDGKWFSHLNTSEIIKESFNAFYHVHPLHNTSVAISHFLTYWIHAAQWFVNTPRKVLIYALVTEVVVQLVNEWIHHYESTTLRCHRQSFIHVMTQSVYDEIWREFILGPFFVYFSLLPRFVLHWSTQLLG